MVGFGDGVPFPLRWGEVIPLHFLSPFLPASTHTVIVSQPNRRYKESIEMIPELRNLGIIANKNLCACTVLFFTGGEIFSIFRTMEEKVAIVISADLAHTHLASGPYGYSNESEPFDQVGSKLLHYFD